MRMAFAWVALIVAAISMTTSSRAQDEFGLSQPIDGQVATVETLVELALQNNPTLAQARAERTKAYGNYVQAGLYPNPTVGYQASEIGNEGYAGQQGGFIQQKFVTANKLGLSKNVAAWNHKAAGQTLSAQQYRVANGTRQEFYRFLTFSRLTDLSRQLVELTGNVHELVKARFEQAEGTKTDVLQAQVEVDRARLQLTSAENDLQAAARRLSAVVGIADLPVAHIQGDLEAGLPELTYEEAFAKVLSMSPELHRARFEASSARAAIDRAKVEAVPNVTLQIGPAYDYSTRDAIANVQLSMPVPVFNRNQGNIVNARGEWARACREVKRLELALERALASQFASYNTSRNQLNQIRDSILPATQQTIELSREAFQAGELEFLQILTIQRTYIETHKQYVQTLGKVWDSAVAIDGLLLIDALSEPTGTSR